MRGGRIDQCSVSWPCNGTSAGDVKLIGSKRPTMACQTYTVIEYQWFTTLISDQGPVATTAGSKELRLSDGKDVVTMSAVPKTLKIIETDKLIRKVR